MLYHLFRYLDEAYDLPGSGMFQYISFRAAAAIILSLLIVIIFGRSIIDFLRRKQIGEEIRDLGLQGQLQKKGTPTMGGVIILVAILVPMLLFGKLDNVYIQLLLVSTVWLGLIGGLDDYIKVFRHRKEGLKGRFKIVGQVGKRRFALRGDLDEKLVVTDDGEEYIVAIKAIFAEHLPAADGSGLPQLLGHIVHKIRMGRHVNSSCNDRPMFQSNPQAALRLFPLRQLRLS